MAALSQTTSRQNQVGPIWQTLERHFFKEQALIRALGLAAIRQTMQETRYPRVFLKVSLFVLGVTHEKVVSTVPFYFPQPGSARSLEQEAGIIQVEGGVLPEKISEQIVLTSIQKLFESEQAPLEFLSQVVLDPSLEVQIVNERESDEKQFRENGRIEGVFPKSLRVILLVKDDWLQRASSSSSGCSPVQVTEIFEAYQRAVMIPVQKSITEDTSQECERVTSECWHRPFHVGNQQIYPQLARQLSVAIPQKMGFLGSLCSLVRNSQVKDGTNFSHQIRDRFMR